MSSKDFTFIALTFSLVVITLNGIFFKAYTNVEMFICLCLYLLVLELVFHD